MCEFCGQSRERRQVVCVHLLRMEGWMDGYLATYNKGGEIMSGEEELFATILLTT